MMQATERRATHEEAADDGPRTASGELGAEEVVGLDVGDLLTRLLDLLDLRASSWRVLRVVGRFDLLAEKGSASTQGGGQW